MRRDRAVLGVFSCMHFLVEDVYKRQEYYNHYIEMRTRQCSMLQSLHWEIQKIRTMPSQAETIAEYITYMKKYVEEKNKMCIRDSYYGDVTSSIPEVYARMDEENE